MNVVYAADHKFISKCGISLTSLVRNNPSPELRVFLLDFGMTEEDRELLRKVRPDLVFLDTSHALDGLPSDTGNFNPVVLVRLLLAEYIPEDVDEILYLDSDTVVNGSLGELETAFSPAARGGTDPYLLAAVPELYMPESKKRFLGLSREDTYYNAGVLWINLRAWREEKLSRTFFSYYQKMGGSLPYNDQDIINHCCRGRIRTLPQKYNMNPNLPYFPLWYMRRVQPAYDMEKAAYEEEIRNPLIVHYMGDERPWLAGNRNYYRGLYEQYKSESLWKDEPWEEGNRKYLACYHGLNLATRIVPHFRMLFTNVIGINVYRWKGKN